MQTPNTTEIGLNQWQGNNLINTTQFNEDNRIVTDHLQSLEARTAADIPMATGEGSVQDALDGNAAAIQDFAGKIGKQLWSGSIAAGETAVVPEIGEYGLFYCVTSTNATPIVCTKNGGYIRGLGTFTTSSTGNQTNIAINLSISGTNVTLGAASSMAHIPGGAHGAATALNLTAIYGLL